MSPKFKGNNAPRGNRKMRNLVSSMTFNPVMYKPLPGTASKVAAYTPSPNGVVVKLPDGSYQVKVIGMPSGRQTIQDISESEIVVALEMSQIVQNTLRDIRAEGRKKIIFSGGGGGGGTYTSRIFHRLVDEHKLGDCIILVMRHFFQGEKECKICNVELNLYDFFLLVQFYFKYIHILENDKQLPFCDFLKTWVFAGNDNVNVRNFNIYANKDAYINFARLLTTDKILESISFDRRPTLPREKMENYLLAPFQEIGWKFQHSDYFAELREEIKKVNQFVV